MRRWGRKLLSPPSTTGSVRLAAARVPLWRLCLAGLLALALPAALAAQRPDARAAEVDAVFSQWDRPGSPGAAVVVVRDGEILYAAGYGTADLDHSLPITPETVFDIASVSKQFTSFAIALLAEEGVLSLDDPIRKWVPELPAEVYDGVTLRHLVHHTGGVRDWVELLWLAGWRFDDVISMPDILELARRQQALNFPPGSQERYSNTGYNLLAVTVGRATGGTFREFMRERIFEPLGMHDTHIHDDHNEIVPDRARSYEPRDGGGWKLLIDNTMGVGSSSVFTTVQDLAKWIRNLEEGTVGGSAVLRQIREPFVLTAGDTIDYAFGLSHGDYRGLPTFGHGGSWRGYRTNLVTFPEHGLGIAVLGNSTAFDAGGSARRVAEVYLGHVMDPAPGERRDRPSPPATALLPASRLADYTGRYYSDELGAVWNLSAADGHLLAGLWTHEPWPLHALAGEDDIFTADGIRGRQTYRFLRDAGGHVTGFTVAGARFNGVRFYRFPQ